MLTATVVGNVWSTRRLAEIPNGAFLELEAEGTGTRLVAFDVLGSGVGERVLVPRQVTADRRAHHRLDRRAGRRGVGGVAPPGQHEGVRGRLAAPGQQRRDHSSGI
jgi:microcompartment protein CcmK/EutM